MGQKAITPRRNLIQAFLQGLRSTDPLVIPPRPPISMLVKGLVGFRPAATAAWGNPKCNQANIDIGGAGVGRNLG